MKLHIINAKGLHARASAKFVETVERFNARAHVEYDGQTVSGDSIMGLMMLGAAQGSEIFIGLEGHEADALGAALRELVEDCFGEGG